MKIKSLPLLLAFGSGCSSGGKDTDPETGIEPGARLELGGSVVCEDPTLRQTLGPMVLYAGEDWDAQHVDVVEDPMRAFGWGVALSDFDGDGAIDVVLPSAMTSELYLAREGGWEIAQTFEGVAQEGESSHGVVSGDLEGDGDLDFVLINAGMNRVLRNDGSGGFESAPISELDSLAEELTFQGAFGDWDGDGDLDLLTADISREGGMEPGTPPEDLEPGVPSHLYENQGDGTFVLADSRLPEESNHGYPFTVSWVDLDADGDLDIYVGNDHGHEVLSNRYWRNEGDRFVDASEETGLGVAADTMGVGIGDLNDDGRPDLAFSGAWELVILESQADGTWVRTEEARGIELAYGADIGWGVELADMDNSGSLDLLAAFGFWAALEGNIPDQPDALYLQEEGLFDEVGADWGIADTGVGRGFALADLNGDGWLDLVKRQIGEPARMYLSRCGEESWLKVRLEQPGSGNPFSVGAKVEIEIAEQTLRRWLSAGSTSLSSSGPMELHFGLGDAEAVDSVVVTWPDGRVSRLDGVSARQTVTVIREE